MKKLNHLQSVQSAERAHANGLYYTFLTPDDGTPEWINARDEIETINNLTRWNEVRSHYEGQTLYVYCHPERKHKLPHDGQVIVCTHPDHIPDNLPNDNLIVILHYDNNLFILQTKGRVLCL